MPVYFASDVHLGGGDPAAARAVERKFLAWLDLAGKDAEAILLVGDIFDFWFEYRRVIPTGYARVLGKLAELTDRGVRVVLFTGNHDMWTGDCLARECGVEVCTSPQVMTLCGRRIFIAHGDNMQIDGQPLLKLLNRVFRSRALRWLFSWGVHPDWAVRFGRWGSGQRESLAQVEPHLMAEHAFRARARAVAADDTFGSDAAQEVEILFHRSNRLRVSSPVSSSTA